MRATRKDQAAWALCGSGAGVTPGTCPRRLEHRRRQGLPQGAHKGATLRFIQMHQLFVQPIENKMAPSSRTRRRMSWARNDGSAGTIPDVAEHLLQQRLQGRYLAAMYGGAVQPQIDKNRQRHLVIRAPLLQEPLGELFQRCGLAHAILAEEGTVRGALWVESPFLRASTATTLRLAS